MSIRLAVALILMAACIEARVLESPRVRAQAMSGCYSVAVSLFQTSDTFSVQLFDALRELRLRTDSLSSEEPGHYRVDVLTDQADLIETGYRMRTWTVGEAVDSVHVIFSHGSGGMGFALRPRGDSLIGDVRVYGDISPFDQRIGRVRAARTGCPAVPRERAPGGAG